jgi:hypothetical protein
MTHRDSTPRGQITTRAVVVTAATVPFLAVARLSGGECKVEAEVGDEEDDCAGEEEDDERA